MAFLLQVREENQLVFQQEFDGPLEVGRQREGEVEPYAVIAQQGGARLVVARLNESRIGRQQLEISLDDDRRVRLANIHDRVALRLADGNILAPGTCCVSDLPAAVLLDNRVVSLESAESSAALNYLQHATRPPILGADSIQAISRFAAPLPTSEEAADLVRALQVALDVFLSAATPRDLFETAVLGAVELVGLDSACLLLRHGSAWEQAYACRSPGHVGEAIFSGRVLAQVLKHGRTFWDPHIAPNTSESLQAVQAVIAAPVLNPQGEVLAVLYGDRRVSYQSPEQRKITQLEAQLIELLAGGVASGLAKLTHEDAARRLRLQFEQFFTPQLVRELEAQPDLLEGRDAEASVLFCDIRGFSRISEKLGAAGTFRWINDVMEALSESVQRFEGVLVDYIGDELMAMWGAPQRQPHHAELACRAALDMLDQMPELNRRWESVLGEPLEIGVGVNSGVVRAGNSGSRRKFKYGPLGNDVNVGSRVQGATKYLKAPLLVTGTTNGGVPDDIPRRRLGLVQLVNIATPVMLFELSHPREGPWRRTFAPHEEALAAFEKQEFRHAAKILSNLLHELPDDGPSLALLKRVVGAMVDGPKSNHPVWTLAGK